jgi:hypothetical protein
MSFYMSIDMDRRNFLSRAGMGMGMLGLSQIFAGESSDPFKPRAPHFAAKAKRVIHIFANGGASQVDTFDPKPLLEKYDGKKIPVHFKTERQTGGAYASRFKFKKYGQSGIPISSLFSELGQHADELCVVRSMHTNVPNHEPSLMMMNCGDLNLPRPSMGSWLNYGLGSENSNLPGFIAMCPGGVPVKGRSNWRSAFLPGIYQGTHIDTKHTDIHKLIDNVRNSSLTYKAQKTQLGLLEKLNARHISKRPGDEKLDSRVKSFELAYKMQMEATDAFDISKEPQYIHDMYGKTTQSRQMLIARRLIERDVRFVQIYHGAGQPWDNHFGIDKGHSRLARESSQGIAALITDLKQRGLLDETLILWSGEFGRTPTVELPKSGVNKKADKPGRDHNNHGFSLWMAGGGVKKGTIYGSTDDFGFAAVENKMHVHDLHATMLHLLGLDHELLTYRYSGRDFRLTDVEGEVIHDIIA